MRGIEGGREAQLEPGVFRWDDRRMDVMPHEPLSVLVFGLSLSH